MDIEFHYWITGWIARTAGFKTDEAKIIAYASQYVDDNDICFCIRDRNGSKNYRNFISQTMNILKPKQELMRIYPIFHFAPGDPGAKSARRRDGRVHLLNTTPDSENANKIIDEALKVSGESRLYRIGIASHSYVDTWAHQNFVGWYDDFNRVGSKLLPYIGHAQAGYRPDRVAHFWTDKRLEDREISNRNRFLEAAMALFNKYCTYLKRENGTDNSAQWKGLKESLVKVMGKDYTGHRYTCKKKRMDYYKGKVDGWLLDFSKDEWFGEAIETCPYDELGSHEGPASHFKDKYYWKRDVDPESTHWYRFQQAVKEHERFALSLLQPRFQKMGVNLKSS